MQSWPLPFDTSSPPLVGRSQIDPVKAPRGGAKHVDTRGSIVRDRIHQLDVPLRDTSVSHFDCGQHVGRCKHKVCKVTGG
jgi:hypothetical protein